MNLLITNSGGKTSAYMTKKILDKYRNNPDWNILVCFANTSQENPETLDFINKCDDVFEFETVWLEAVVHFGERVASTHKVVNYDVACRDGYVFEDVIKEYGIPNKAYPHCNREMKLNPIHDYAEQYFEGEKYKTAIGIRIDETRRVSEKAEKAHSDGIVYPLVDWWPADKIDVNDFWEDQDFTLELKEHQGNCATCWKKSDRKLWTIAVENPEKFDFFDRMEKTYPHAGHNDGIRPRVFFRRNRMVANIFAEAKEIDFKRFVENTQIQDKLFGYDIDEDSGCSESCEPFDME